jgi:tRNA(Arg) A34 adenosine deaminase TadA
VIGMRGTRLPSALALVLPDWLGRDLAETGPLPDVDARMALVLELARHNVERSQGGPFAAAVFSVPNGELVAAGVNLVVSSSAPIAHAEIIAIALAGQRLETYDLRAGGPTELVTSCEPCAMCLGAVPWSGVSRIVTGARDEDARAVGFDEGDKPRDWVSALHSRGIEVARDVRRAEATEVLRDYARRGGPIYNGARRTGRREENRTARGQPQGRRARAAGADEPEQQGPTSPMGTATVEGS